VLHLRGGVQGATNGTQLCHWGCAKRYSSRLRSAVFLWVIPTPSVGGHSEGIMTRSAASPKRTGCLYCGLQSAVSPNHASIAECVDALQLEVTQLRDHLRPGRQPSVPVVSRHAPNQGTAGAMSARLKRVR
jgi:hypothetical protein